MGYGPNGLTACSRITARTGIVGRTGITDAWAHAPESTATMSHRYGYNRINVTSWRFSAGPTLLLGCMEGLMGRE